MNIALLTDFGTKDYFVGAMKGVILLIDENAKIIDITHEIEPQNINAASFTLRACYRNFPARTIFVAVVDPGVGSQRRAILVETEKYFFIAPDNGLLSFVFDEAENFRVIELANEKFFNHPVSTTFHGRDIFAPCAAHLSSGVSPGELGREIADFNAESERFYLKNDGEIIEAQIIHIDHFGNLITNLKNADLPPKFSLKIGGRKINKVQIFFAEAAKDELFLIAGSAGFWEIAAFQNSAKKILSAGIGDKIKVFVEK